MKSYYFGTNPLGPSRKVKAAVRKAAKDINTLPGDGQERLERLFLSKYGIGKESILFANSLKELLFVICRRLQPRKILIIGPALNVYQEAARASGAVIEALCGNEESFFLPDLHALVNKAEGCDLVFIAIPNRISGKTLSEAVLKQVFAALALKDCVTVVDESLIEFTGDEGCIRRVAKSRLDGAANSNNIIVLRTTAYYFGLPGLELACAVAGPRVIASLRQGLQSDPSILAVAAARTALKDKSYRRLSEKFMKEEKKLLGKAIRKMPGIIMYDSDTNIFLLKAADLALEIAGKAARAGLAVELCSEIEGLDDQFLRISVMKHDHNLKFIKLLKGMRIEKSEETRSAD